MSPAEEAEALCNFWMARQIMELGSFDISKEDVIEALQQLRAKSRRRRIARHMRYGDWRLSPLQLAVNGLIAF